MKGGRQPGAGRPKGTLNKKRFSDYVDERQMLRIVNKAMRLAEGGNEQMIKLCIEMHMGKAVQPIGNPEGETFKVDIISPLKKAYGDPE